MVKHVLVSNLGSEFDISAPDINLKLVSGQLIKTAAGEIGIDPAALAPVTTHALTLVGSNLTSTVNGVAPVLDLAPAIAAAETTTTLGYNPATKTLTYVNEDAVTVAIDLSSLAVDVDLSSGTFDPATFVMTLTDDDGGVVTINLAELKKVVTASSNSIALTGTGEASAPLKADVVVDPIAGNLMQVTAAGVKVIAPAVPAQTPIAVTDSSTIDLTPSGPDNHTITAAVKFSAAVGNQALANADGVFVPAPVVADFWRSGVGGTALPDGATDLTDAIRHNGFVGVNQDPASSVDATSFGASATQTNAATYVLGDADHTVRMFGAAVTAFTNPAPTAANVDRIYVIANHGVGTGTLAINDIDGFNKNLQILPGMSVTIQQIAGAWCVIDKYIPTATPIDETVDVTGATLPIVFPIATIPGAPVFAPNQPATANKLYVFPNGQTAVWDGTQYVAYVAPGKDYWSNITTTAAALSPPDGVNDLTEKLRREGAIGLAVDPLTTLDVNGSISWGITLLTPSATAYTVLPADSTIAIAETLSFTGNQQINLPSAGAFPRRVITFRSPVNSPYVATIVSGGGNIEMPNYQLESTVFVKARAYSSITWQSDGNSWRLLTWDDRAFYGTQGYPVPTTASTFVGTGGIAPAAGAAYQIPATATSWAAADGNYTPLIALPITNNATGRFSVYAANSVGLPTTISHESTDLPRNTNLVSGLGRSLHFEWSDGLWRWVYAPEVTAPVSLKKFFQTIALAANTGFVLTHNLGLAQPKAYTINAIDATGQTVQLRQTAQTANTITLTSNVALANIDVTVIG